MRGLPVVVLLLVGLVWACAGAESATDAGASRAPPPAGTVATVDTLIAPARIAPTDTLRLRLRGTVGPNGCYALARIETARNRERLTVRPVVRYRGGEGAMCTMALVPLDASHAVPPPFTEGRLTIVVPQPDGPDVTATVTVRADA